MAWLPMYLLGRDRELVVERFNDDQAIAWLVCAGTGRWRAVATVAQIPRCRRLGLWHVLSGPLPLLAAGPDEPDGLVADPWEGWVELRAGAEPDRPYFGPGHPGVYWLSLPQTPESQPIEMSTIEWIGNRYASIGNPAPAVTERHWRALRRWATRQGTRIPRFGAIDGPGPEVMAFPNALAAMRAGRARHGNMYHG
jgi:hypothetical protein